MILLRLVVLVVLCIPGVAGAQIQFDFEEDLTSGPLAFDGGRYEFVPGVDGMALSLSSPAPATCLTLPGLALDGSTDFSVQYWVRTKSALPTVYLSQKEFTNKGIGGQKNPGWALYGSGGTLGWCIGSGTRRVNYERDNGARMPLNDGAWHQVTMTYNRALAEIRLYYDNRPVAVYHVGFEFSNDEPLRIGTAAGDIAVDYDILPDIREGAADLQAVVDAFHQLRVGAVRDNELIDLIVDPEALYQRKLQARGGAKAESTALHAVMEARRTLHGNPYTVYQNLELTRLKPVSQIYVLAGGRVRLDPEAARHFTRSETLFPADFSMDRLVICDRVLDADEVAGSYASFREAKVERLPERLESLTVGVWNIWHGGIHWNLEQHGWDSRLRIVEMLRELDVDIVLLQETYSHGDFIAAELGWSLAAGSDWDYCFQGANVSVLSRFPIKELHVLPETEFNNVGVKLAVSKTQDVYAMSNWYGMDAFPDVYAFHATRFAEWDRTPIFFGGDFNAVPHTDGGTSPASVKMLESGFTDAFRSLHPDGKENPGHTHRSGHRIDQLYYRGKGMENISTKVISDWPSGFPSDHSLIVSHFDLKDRP